MLDGVGKLTDIGSWYLGGAEVESASSTSTSSAPAGSSSVKSGAGGLRVSGDVVGSLVLGVGVVVGLVFG